MATQTIQFTKTKLDGIKHPSKGTERYRDARFANLYFEVGARTKVWRFRKFKDGKNTVRTLGTWPQDDWLVAARRTADADEAVNRGHRNPKPNREFTLAEALDRHTRNPVDPRTKRKSEATIYDYENTLSVHASDWLKLPIDKITRADVNARIKSLANKPTTATKLLRIVSAVYANEMAVRDDFDHDPTHRVKAYALGTGSLLFDVEKTWPALDLIMKVEDIRERSMWLAMLFTGIRMGNVRAIEWDHLDLDQMQLTIPKLKNGQSRTFPLSDAAVAAFKRVPKIDDRWVFASRTRSHTPMTNLRNLGDPKIMRPHDTRRLFTTAAEQVGLSDSTVNFLRGDITLTKGARGRYIFSAGSHDDVNAIEKQIVSRCGPYSDLVSTIVSA